MDTCKECRYFKPCYYQLGRCIRQTAAGSKIHTDDSKAEILVHITFGCNQWEAIPKPDEEMI